MRTRYTNLDGTVPENRLKELLRWRLTRKPDRSPFETPRRPNDGSALAAPGAHLTWIGHATFVMRLGDKLVATDPIWSSRIHTIPRLSPPGVELERCPPIDVVTISHAHYDHLDLPTLRRIGPRALYVVPRDVGDVLRSAGLERVVELGWWESHVEGDLRITLVPAQHWSCLLYTSDAADEL